MEGAVSTQQKSGSVLQSRERERPLLAGPVYRSRGCVAIEATDAVRSCKYEYIRIKVPLP